MTHSLAVSAVLGILLGDVLPGYGTKFTASKHFHTHIGVGDGGRGGHVPP